MSSSITESLSAAEPILGDIWSWHLIWNPRELSLLLGAEVNVLLFGFIWGLRKEFFVRGRFG